MVGCTALKLACKLPVSPPERDLSSILYFTAILIKVFASLVVLEWRWQQCDPRLNSPHISPRKTYDEDATLESVGLLDLEGLYDKMALKFP